MEAGKESQISQSGCTPSFKRR
uniref:Uncharacterized protein n=1 Tax=Anguilla anguilla TaxID=7936 RepID=A0A0E9VUC9_ANGAN